MAPGQATQRQIGHRQARAAPALVDNPLYNQNHGEAGGNPKKIEVAINIKESAVTSLAMRGMLSETQAHAAARFEGAWRKSASFGLRPQRYGPGIDVGRWPGEPGAAALTAAAELRKVEALVGQRGLPLADRHHRPWLCPRRDFE